MKEFNVPEIEVVNFDDSDIIVTSDCPSGEPGRDECVSGQAPDLVAG